MLETSRERDELARVYADSHLSTDVGIQAIYYLPGNAPHFDIRLLEVNTLMPERPGDVLEPVDGGVHVGQPAGTHRLLVMDVTPAQWAKILAGELALPAGWSLEGARLFARATAAA